MDKVEGVLSRLEPEFQHYICRHTLQVNTPGIHRDHEYGLGSKFSFQICFQSMTLAKAGQAS